MRHQVAARLFAPVLVWFAVLAIGAASPVFAAGVVGLGSPGSCSQDALETALMGGGLVTFNCGASPKTIALFFGTGEVISADTTVDGGGLITIDSSALDFPVFNVNTGVTLTVENLTLVMVNPSSIGIPVISNAGTLVATNCTLTDKTYAAVV